MVLSMQFIIINLKDGPVVAGFGPSKENRLTAWMIKSEWLTIQRLVKMCSTNISKLVEYCLINWLNKFQQ